MGQHLEIGQKFLYENHCQDLSRSQKLQKRRLGPFTVTKRVTNTTYQIQDDEDPTVLETVHRNHRVESYPKEETLPPMIEEYVPMDRRPDDFYERFMEQRLHKINKPEQFGKEDSLPFPIEPLRTAPVTLPQKRVSNTSSDSGVNSSQVLSPAMPKTPDNSQSFLIASTSRMRPPSGPLTPIQQFIKNPRPRSPNTIALSPIILIQNRCFELALALAKDINSNFFYNTLYSLVYAILTC